MAESVLDVFWVSQAFDVVEQCRAEGCSGRPGPGGVDPGGVAFEGGEERLDRGVVVAVAGGAEGLAGLEFE